MIVLTVIAVLLAAFRIAGYTSAFFQGIAHIFVGGLFGAWWVGRKPYVLGLAVGLTVIEVICFIAFGGLHHGN